MALLGVPALAQPGDTKISRTQLDDIRAIVAKRGTIGLSVDTSDAQSIISVADGSPACRAGVKAGDRLLMIDGELCNNDFQATVLKLIGEPGSSVGLTIRRNNEAIEFDVVRR